LGRVVEVGAILNTIKKKGDRIKQMEEGTLCPAGNGDNGCWQITKKDGLNLASAMDVVKGGRIV